MSVFANYWISRRNRAKDKQTYEMESKISLFCKYKSSLNIRRPFKLVKKSVCCVNICFFSPIILNSQNKHNKPCMGVDKSMRMAKYNIGDRVVKADSVNKGVIVSGEQAKADMSLTTCEIKDGTFNQLKSVTGDAMVGCFNYQGKTALYVVNYSMEHAQKITLTFDGSQNVKMIQNAEESYVKGKALTLDMAAGEGILLVLE